MAQKYGALLNMFPTTFFRNNNEIWYYLTNLGLKTAQKFQTVYTIEEAEYLIKKIFETANLDNDHVLNKMNNVTMSVISIDVNSLKVVEIKVLKYEKI
jgi:hypothetical protein